MQPFYFLTYQAKYRIKWTLTEVFCQFDVSKKSCFVMENKEIENQTVCQ